MNYSGYLSSNNVEVHYECLGRKASGSGKCAAGQIEYGYVFTEGRPKGKKGFAKICLKQKAVKKIQEHIEESAR